MKVKVLTKKPAEPKRYTLDELDEGTLVKYHYPDSRSNAWAIGIVVRHNPSFEKHFVPLIDEGADVSFAWTRNECTTGRNYTVDVNERIELSNADL